MLSVTCRRRMRKQSLAPKSGRLTSPSPALLALLLALRLLTPAQRAELARRYERHRALCGLPDC